MNRDLIDRSCERGILAVMLGILVFGPLSAGAVRTQELLVIVGLTAVILALWAVRLWTNERPKLLWPPICWAVVVLGSYAVWRYTVCDIEYVGRLELLRVLTYCTLFLAVINNLHRQESTQAIAYTLIFLAMIVAVIAGWQFLSRSAKVPALSALLESMAFPGRSWFFARPYMERASGTYVNPNHLAGFLEMLVPMAMAFVLTGRAKAHTKVFLSYAALVMLAAIALTGSRGSWLSTGMSLFLLFALLATHRNFRLPASLLLVVMIGAGIFAVSRENPFKRRAEATLVEGQVHLDMRGDIWKATSQMWQDHLWTGVGPGHYDYRFREYRPASVQLRPDRAHNDYLNVLVDWGLAGGLLLAGLVGLLALGVRKTWRYVRRAENDFKSNRSDKFAFVLGTSFGLLALAIHSLVDFNLQIPANAILAVTLAALLCSHLRFATEQFWYSAGVPLRAVLTVFLLAGFLGLAWQSLHLGREYVWLARASTQANFSDAKIHDLEQAYSIEPRNPETTWSLGEAYRIQSFEGGDNYEALGQKALLWFGRGTNNNRFDGYNYLGYGQCLDFLGRTNESPAYFSRADELDPKGYFTSALIGLHYRELGDFAACRTWSERSLFLQRTNNTIATANLQIANDRLLENAMRPAPGGKR